MALTGGLGSDVRPVTCQDLPLRSGAPTCALRVGFNACGGFSGALGAAPSMLSADGVAFGAKRAGFRMPRLLMAHGLPSW